MAPLEKLRRNEKEIREKFGVKRIGIFGSAARGKVGEKSNVDVLVEFKEGQETFDNFMELAFHLEELFGRKVDLLTPEGLRGIRVQSVKDEIKKSVTYV